MLTTGVAGDRPGPGWTVAASVCVAINSLTWALAVELAPLRVNAVAPGMARSPLWSGIPEADREAMYAETAKNLPLGRIADAREAAEPYLYLMTSGYSTGSIVTADCGYVLV